MKVKPRHWVLAIFLVLGVVCAIGAWTTHKDPNNQGGFLIAFAGILIVVWMFASAGIQWAVDRLRGKKRAG
jgi:uncharacterized membrane protein YphA (DoxX/SURF4 family)